MPVTVEYLVLAIALTVTLNHRNRFVRDAGTLLAAIGRSFMVLSVYSADTDGTFAALPAGSARAKLLNVHAAAALIASVFLLWATWCQLRRPLTADLPWRNTGATYGLISGGAHSATATLVLCLNPIGLFMQRLPVSSPERPVFVAVHGTLGIAVLVLVIVLLAWFGSSSPLPLSSSVAPAFSQRSQFNAART